MAATSGMAADTAAHGGFVCRQSQHHAQAGIKQGGIHQAGLDVDYGGLPGAHGLYLLYQRLLLPAVASGLLFSAHGLACAALFFSQEELGAAGTPGSGTAGDGEDFE